MSSANIQTQPDDHANGLLERPVNPLRYEWELVEGPEGRHEVPSVVAKWLPPQSDVLDVGCGTGAVAAGFALHCRRYVGLEPQHERVLAARAKGLDVREGMLDERFLRSLGPFDVITFTDVLEHVPNPSSLLSIASKGLRRGGLVIASVPNVAHWTIRLKLLRGKFEYEPFGLMDATHLRWFTRKTLFDLFERQGWIIEEQTVTPGFGDHNYHRAIVSWLPRDVRRRIVEGLAFSWPALFGYQHVIRARLP